MKTIRPIYGQDYAPGYDIFSVKPGNVISEGIIWFQNIDESIEYEELLKVKGFSHVFGVIDEEWGIEASEQGVLYVRLSDYFDDPDYIVVCREPECLISRAIVEKNNYMGELIGRPYDIPALGLGFAAMILSKITNLIPFWRKTPIPFHLPGARVCSSLIADGWKHTEQYCDIALFREWNITRIHVHKLWNGFPYKPFRYDKER
jgi:hypothetical protein